MVKARSTTKKKQATVMIDLDVNTVNALEEIAQMCDLTPSQVVNVYLATTIYNRNGLGLGDK